jgi:hypothetical protein
LLGHAREPLPTKPGHTEKVDTEYWLNRTCGIFMVTEPLAGWRHARVAEKDKTGLGVLHHMAA